MDKYATTSTLRQTVNYHLPVVLRRKAKGERGWEISSNRKKKVDRLSAHYTAHLSVSQLRSIT